MFLTHPSPAPSMQPESSDGFASVGTILPRERAALLPGGSFLFREFVTFFSQDAEGAPGPSHLRTGDDGR